MIPISVDPSKQSTMVSSSGDEKLCIYGGDEMNVHILYIYMYNYIYTYAAYIYHMVMMAGSSASSALHPAAKSQCVGRAQRAWEGPGIASRTMGVVTFYLQKLSFGHPIWLAVFRNVDDLPGETVHFRSLAARFPEAIRLEHQPIAGGDGSSIPKRPFRTKSGVRNLWFCL